MGTAQHPLERQDMPRMVEVSGVQVEPDGALEEKRTRAHERRRKRTPDGPRGAERQRRRALAAVTVVAPYVRAAAATGARCGLPVIRPLCLVDPSDPRGWEIADAYLFGPSLWVAPVLEEGARAREVPLPRGDWIDFWTGAPAGGGETVVAEAPLERIPVFVRSGAILVSYPSTTMAAGLGDVREDRRPLSISLWGRPACGATGVRLADGTRIRWRAGAWSVTPAREARFVANSL
jgi:hypothetical protein